jgi:hypothetical protein
MRWSRNIPNALVICALGMTSWIMLFDIALLALACFAVLSNLA